MARALLNSALRTATSLEACSEPLRTAPYTSKGDPMSKSLRGAAAGLFAVILSSSAFAADLVVVNRCQTSDGAVYLGALERGGACEDCVASLKLGAAKKPFLGKIAFGERADLTATKTNATRLFTYLAGQFRQGVEVERKGQVDIVGAEGGGCELRKVIEKLASAK